MTEEERQNYLDGYLDGSLTADEKALVKKWLIQDPHLDKEMNELKQVRDDLQRIGLGKFQDRVTGWESEYRSNADKKSGKLIKYLAIAASIAILAVSVTILFRPADTQSLYTEYYSPYDDLLSTRGDVESSMLSTGMAAYNSGDFETAAEHLSRYVKTSDNPIAWLYLGISHLELDEYEQALLAFAAAESSSSTTQQAEWYTGLVHLKAHDMSEARTSFQNIASDPLHYKQKEAEQLLFELD